jgi:hypothetical protein
MAAALSFNKTEVDVNEFGRDVEVPEKPIAKLMYYFDSICYAMDMNRTASPDKIKKLRNYSKYLQWPKGKGQMDKQRSTKHTHKTKDRVTRTPLKTQNSEITSTSP